MLSLSRGHQIQESERKAVLAGCASKGYEMESQPGTDTKTIYIYFFPKEYFYALKFILRNVQVSMPAQR